MTWLVNPPNGHGNHNFKPMHCASYEAAVELAKAYPPNSRIVEMRDDTGVTVEGASAPSPAIPRVYPRRADDFCTEAARLVSGDREAQHGDKKSNFECVALLWNAYIRARALCGKGTGWDLEAVDVGSLMELLKVARRLTGSFNADDYIDAAGYAGCTGEIAAAQASSHASREP